MNYLINRRTLLKFTGASALAAFIPAAPLFSAPALMRTKAIPKTGESLPVIGMGTWRTFNIGSDPQLLNARTEIVKAFLSAGGSLIDSSPMYGSAPDVMGYALKQLGMPADLFSAEKVWSPAGGNAREQFAELTRRWGLSQFDLFQIHNLDDWETHLNALVQMKAEGKIRYIGITTSHGRRHGEFEKLLANEHIDFAQLTHNITHREVEERLLPLARERKIAVIANRPYDGGYLIQNLKRRETIPEWAKQEFGCESWADFLLRFVVSHPAINCAIPATSKLAHLHENMYAGTGPMPDEATRRKMIQYIESV